MVDFQDLPNKYTFLEFFLLHTIDENIVIFRQ